MQVSIDGQFSYPPMDAYAQKAKEYATCRWNQMCSSAGKSHIILGRTTRMTLRNMGTRIMKPS